MSDPYAICAAASPGWPARPAATPCWSAVGRFWLTFHLPTQRCTGALERLVQECVHGGATRVAEGRDLPALVDRLRSLSD